MSNNSTTGVTGNTNIPQQQHAAAGSYATMNRVKSFAKNNKVLMGILALVAAYSVTTVFTSNDMGLGGLLVFLFLLRYAHKQYEKNSKPTVSSLIGHLITAIIVLVIIASPPVQKLLEGFNWAAEELGEIDIETSMGDIQISREGTDFTIKNQGDTILDLSDVPEGVVYDFANAVNVTANGKTFTMEEFVSHLV
jgi:hypothetical protein